MIFIYILVSLVSFLTGGFVFSHFTKKAHHRTTQKASENIKTIINWLNFKPVEILSLDTSDCELKPELDKLISQLDHRMREELETIERFGLIIEAMGEGSFDTHLEIVTHNPWHQELVTKMNEAFKALHDMFFRINQISTSLGIKVNQDEHKTLRSKFDAQLDAIVSTSMSHISKHTNEHLIRLEKVNNDITHEMDTLSEQSAKQAASLEETSAAIEEITGTIKGNTDKAEQMRHLALLSKNNAQKGNTLIQTNAISMDEIEKSTLDIANAITQIEQLAFQTNILSLNAAVESATAGEHGKGFAVVAAEVRNLAGKSAEAAKQIKFLVHEATEKSKKGKDVSRQVTASFDEMIINITTTANLVEEVAIASKEQFLAITQINQSTMELDAVTQRNSSISQNTNHMLRDFGKIITEIRKPSNHKN